MGVKGFIWLALLVIMTLFIIQNLQEVSLVFFSSKSVTLPLSILMLLFALTGIIVSLIIQGLINLSRSNSESKFNNEKASYSSPPPQSRAKKKPEIEPQFQPVYPTYKEPYDDLEFVNEDNIQETVEDQKIQEPVDSIIEEQKIAFNLEEIEKNDLEEEVDLEPKNQTRSPSLYSYTPKERTQIKPKPKFSPSPRSRIYDANYRVIAPASPKNNPQIDENENEEEWDF